MASETALTIACIVLGVLLFMTLLFMFLYRMMYNTFDNSVGFYNVAFWPCRLADLFKGNDKTSGGFSWHTTGGSNIIKLNVDNKEVTVDDPLGITMNSNDPVKLARLLFSIDPKFENIFINSESINYKEANNKNDILDYKF